MIVIMEMSMVQKMMTTMLNTDLIKCSLDQVSKTREIVFTLMINTV